MRKLTFEPYAKPAEGEKIPLHVRVWALLFQAVNNPNWKSGDDVLKVRAAAKMIDKLETVQDTITEGDKELTHQKHEGGTVLLEDAEFARLEDAWKALRPQLPGNMAREFIAVTDFLEKAPTVETAEVKA